MNQQALAAVAVALVYLAWKHRAKLGPLLAQAVAAPAAAQPLGPAPVIEARILTDNQALLERRLETLQGMRYDAADLPDEARRTKLLKFLDEAREVARELTPLDDVLPIVAGPKGGDA